MAADSSAPLDFPRSRRLKQGRDFLRIKAKGKRVVCGCLVANFLMGGDASPTRLGVITSRKIGNAVVRSRARRLLREAFRLHQRELVSPVDLVLVARASIVGKKFAEVEKDLLQVMQRSGLLKSKA